MFGSPFSPCSLISPAVPLRDKGLIVLTEVRNDFSQCCRASRQLASLQASRAEWFAGVRPVWSEGLVRGGGKRLRCQADVPGRLLVTPLIPRKEGIAKSGSILT